MTNLDRIFRDYEVQLSTARTRTIELDAQEVRRAEFAKVMMGDRLAAQIGFQVQVFTDDAQKWDGVLENVGLGWLQLRTSAESLVMPTARIVFWEGGTPFSTVDAQAVQRKLSFAFALRALVKARETVRLYHAGRLTSEGVLERVGADFVELSTRGSSIHKTRVVPLHSIVAVGTA
ncbi:histidine kinase [Rothia sp. ZJ1223]|uniref:histidine kinase n=1 Tax=Rothia sp. ZJ1223 TaxID=2811098 RepID=UPI00195E46DD|nr:histidine kinase [Rothia sp. ZJ1223]MBM7050842.1 histidine kinase [Rothia sp. ZJ1223]